MPRKALFEWEGREYDHNPKSTDWYWALGIIAVAAAVAAIRLGSRDRSSSEDVLAWAEAA